MALSTITCEGLRRPFSGEGAIGTSPFHVCKGSVHEVREVAICKVGCSDYRRLASTLLGESRSSGIRNPDLDGSQTSGTQSVRVGNTV